MRALNRVAKAEKLLTKNIRITRSGPNSIWHVLQDIDGDGYKKWVSYIIRCNKSNPFDRHINLTKNRLDLKKALKSI